MAALSTAALLARYLHAAGVRHVFGYPDESVIDFMEAARHQGIEMVSAVREGTAAFMAEAAAMAAGLPGVCLSGRLPAGVIPWRVGWDSWQLNLDDPAVSDAVDRLVESILPLTAEQIRILAALVNSRCEPVHSPAPDQGADAASGTGDGSRPASLSSSASTPSSMRGLAVPADVHVVGATVVAAHRARLRTAWLAGRAEDKLNPSDVVAIARESAPPDTIVTTDVGSHKIMAGQVWQSFAPRSALIPNGLSAMGSACPRRSRRSSPDRTGR